MLLLVGAFLLSPIMSTTTLAQNNIDYGLGQVSQGLGGSLGDNDLPVVVGKIINVVLGLLGTVAIVVILIGGFKWMTAGGNDDQVGEAKKWIFSGIIGLAIILSSWAITRFVFKSLHTAITGGDLEINQE